MHKRLRRLETITVSNPVFFITTCTAKRQTILACDSAFEIIRGELEGAEARHGWTVGRFVVMPDHLHFMCAPTPDNRRDLSRFVGSIKEWTSKRLVRELRIEPPIWQPTFFDHVLRSDKSYEQKAEYMWNNPVRAGLVSSPEQWPYAGDLSP